ncbi:MAG: FAD-binding protein [Clostridia bacterium]|nr:FAD-binding protein [Clostridia bacterium]
MSNTIFDIAVIGAGPAGSTFARTIADTGRKVLLIDGETKENMKPCGGLLSPDAQKYMAKYRMTIPNDILVNPQIFAVDTVDLVAQKATRYQRHYLNMDRYLFDKYLLSIVPDSVEIVRGRVKSISENPDRYCIEIQLESGEKLTVSSEYIVGADGASSVVRKSLFQDRIHVKKYVAIQEWFRIEGIEPWYYCIFDEETSDSCSWFMQKDGYSIFGGAFDPKNNRENYEKQKQKFAEYIGYSLDNAVKFEACLVTSPRKRSDFALSNGKAFLIGEAAGFISASSFEGISCALISGFALSEAFRNGKDADGIKKIYRKKTLKLRLKLQFKMFKRFVICNPFLRKLIMKSGITSV